MSKISIIKIIKITIIITFSFTACLFNNNVLAFSLPCYSLGSSKIIPDHQIFINGKKIEDPKKEFVIETNKPILFGYTLENVNVVFTIVESEINGSQIILKAVSDNAGYWICYSNEELEHGVYEVFMTISDANGMSSEMLQVGTFKVPEVLPKSLEASNDRILIPSPSLNDLNYLTVSLIVGGIVILIAIFYLLIRLIIKLIEE